MKDRQDRLNEVEKAINYFNNPAPARLLYYWHPGISADPAPAINCLPPPLHPEVFEAFGAKNIGVVVGIYDRHHPALDPVTIAIMDQGKVYHPYPVTLASSQMFNEPTLMFLSDLAALHGIVVLWFDTDPPQCVDDTWEFIRMLEHLNWKPVDVRWSHGDTQ